MEVLNGLSSILIITRDDNDFVSALLSSGVNCKTIKPEEITRESLHQYKGIAILGGTQNQPLVLEPDQRLAIEEAILLGINVFAEYVTSIGDVYFDLPITTRYERLVYVSNDDHITSMEIGTILDDQCGMRIPPHDISLSKSIPILQFVKTNAHDQITVSEQLKHSHFEKALWFEHQENLLVCAFRLSNFKRSRYAPWPDIKQVIEFIIEWLSKERVSLNSFEPAYKLGSQTENLSFEKQLSTTINNAMKWFEDADIVSEHGRKGAIEGLATEIYPDGIQKRHTMLRADCIGEVSLPYFFDYLLTGNERSLEISDNLNDYLFNYYICKDKGELSGMMRWTNEAWGVCYQDDVARAILPQLFKSLILKDNRNIDEIVEVLNFLVRTTGIDGTRVFRTDNVHLTESSIQELQSSPGNLPSAHYNAYYYAALLIAYKLTGNNSFQEVAVKGLTTIMDIYPNTVREQSETQEYCRLIFPLSCLYWVTQDQTHKDWLYRVTADLEKLQHESGGYLEWDTGYQAAMRNDMGEGESSLLVQNGDSIMDFLYSNNWLPMAFMQAYYVTGDELFKKKWEEISAFFIQTQIHSDNKDINGGWARAYDPKKKEVFGSPADTGWGPWTIESGWTVAEISAGLSYGLLEHKVASLFKSNK